MRCWLEANPGQLSGTTEEDGQRDGHPPCLQVILTTCEQGRREGKLILGCPECRLNPASCRQGGRICSRAAASRRLGGGRA